MILLFGAMMQTHDYRVDSVLQIVGIVLSWLCMAALLAYYVFMGLRLRALVRMSVRDAGRFCHRGYLFRENMMSIVEAAVHPSELYLNYLRAARIVVFGTVTGLCN